MKKMFGVVVILLLLYIITQAIYSYTTGSRVTKYKLVVDGDEYQITEKFSSKRGKAEKNQTEMNNYYFEIESSKKEAISFKIVGEYSGKKEILKSFKIYSDNNMTCIYPIFKDKTDNVDVICKDNEKQYLYGFLKGQRPSLDAFVASLREDNYTHPSWDNINMEEKEVETFITYPVNFTDNQTITVWLYKGFSKVTERNDKLFLFGKSEQYEPLLTSMVNQYYIIPDYAKEHKFDRFFVTNLLTEKMEPFDMEKDISYDSFVQGVVDNKIYLIDRNAKKQYSIDIYNKEVVLIGDEKNNTKYYNNGKWESKSIFEVIDNTLLFSELKNIPEELESYDYLYIDEVGGGTDGYYYLYVKENNEVYVYRADKQNIKSITLLFKTPSIKDVQYVARDLYFINDDTLFMYRDDLGLRPLIKYNEFRFNPNRLYNVYVNK